MIINTILPQDNKNFTYSLEDCGIGITGRLPISKAIYIVASLHKLSYVTQYTDKKGHKHYNIIVHKFICFQELTHIYDEYEKIKKQIYDYKNTIFETYEKEIKDQLYYDAI
jgi:hypothetical protein